ncbi:MAG TPA: LacI family DNA-binding transcriptional regulator [Solirubrobacteraceae bacterium]|nr:LacI family DNA-binding transcriptional regulator [Solirubrobacteraceae bacterium]
MSRVGVKEVARAAGVSVGTVSNVLNRPEIVRDETRFRVQAEMERLGFVRNESARQLRQGRSRTLAYVFLDATNPFFTDVARGAEAAAEAAGLALFLCNSNGDPAREDRYLDLLHQQRVLGILITALDYGNPQLRTLPEQGTPVVLVDHPADVAKAWCSVAVDDRLGGEVAVAHLLEQGHERIAFAGGPFSLPQIADRLEGARRALAGSSAELIVLETDEPTVATGRLAAQRLIGLPKRQRPTALFCANDVMALGALQQLLLAGVAVPSEVAIVGYDDIDFAGAAAVPLTSVRQPRDRLGRTATELLIAETLQNGHEHHGVTFVPELMVRDSTRGKAR